MRVPAARGKHFHQETLVYFPSLSLPRYSRPQPSASDSTRTPERALRWLKNLEWQTSGTDLNPYPRLRRLLEDKRSPKSTLTCNKLVRECLDLGKISVLKAILKHVPIATLILEGRISTKELQLLLDAMPDDFPTGTLELRDLRLGRHRSELIFGIMAKMPALKKLSLDCVHVADGGQQLESHLVLPPELPKLDLLQVKGNKPLYQSSLGWGTRNPHVTRANVFLTPLLPEILKRMRPNFLAMEGTYIEEKDHLAVCQASRKYGGPCNLRLVDVDSSSFGPYLQACPNLEILCIDSCDLTAKALNNLCVQAVAAQGADKIPDVAMLY